MQETIKRDVCKDTKYYKWNVTTDETTKPRTIIIPNRALILDCRQLYIDYNRNKLGIYRNIIINYKFNNYLK